ncbi:CPBP family intramembrane metalloprotease [Bacillus wiedmannii]|uniref:CPBP family intramembrane glutamic endopeptidase n=1 Tax=Bacillus wiedmannii TaxID=1890302 RepID=UPI000BF78FE0|nr:CPBP family intramembrane glutamic endopeptidase [Bacillus wiedmannii]PEP22047.1 CPBP family intramembrane metalloprotease [Bacillus wiedmannii]PEP96748.1 CPBP family intramembrane metalloprotease [Bacillus wiedmannii]PFY72458.1 CPBP family intramembrane metalloprotease [Bacillus wiedmannii]
MESYSKYIFYLIKASLCIMLTAVLIGLVRLTDNYLKWGIFEVDGFQMSSVFMLLIAVFIVFKSVRDYFFQHFVKIRKKHLAMATGISIFLGIGLQISFSFVANFINTFNPNLIKPGSDQYVSAGNLSIEGEVVIVGLLGPFNEEVIFRLFTYVYFFSLFNKYKGKLVRSNRIYDGSEEKEKYFKILWLIVSNILFVIYHGADITNFWVYFIPGVIYGTLFIKYGFFAAWIGHSAFNVSSNTVHEVMVYLFSG